MKVLGPQGRREILDLACGYGCHALALLRQRGMEIFAAYSDYYGREATHRALQLMVCSRKARG